MTPEGEATVLVADDSPDNVAMVMNDCNKDPAKVSACVGKASTVAELEAKCLKQLDDEGTEGNELKK